MGLIDYSSSDIRLYSESGELIERPVMNSTQNVSVEVSGEDKVPYRVGFYQSANLYTLDVKLDGTGADAFPVKTARFANVAFSNGSLLAGFLRDWQSTSHCQLRRM